ncbi:hypothetical protein ACH41E_01615 [Streptomyces sp. NPDC020412]|uniref:hypothetical protein n=1 Tax=Streptomyces sp. NPDC020412 TaxID=3365073 RepID=UPI00378DE003
MALNVEPAHAMPDGTRMVRLWDCNAPHRVVVTPRAAFTRFLGLAMDDGYRDLEATDDEMTTAARSEQSAVDHQYGILPDPPPPTHFPLTHHDTEQHP